MSGILTLAVWVAAVASFVQSPVPMASPSPSASPSAEPRGSAPLRRALEQAAQVDPGFRPVGGKPTTLALHPWQVGLLAASVANNGRAQFCGGSIVAPRWVLTAAHCVNEGTVPSDVEVLTGTASLETGGNRITVTDIKVHAAYNKTTNDSDIALLRVAGNLGGTPIAGLTPADEGAHLRVDAPVTISGWGALAFGSHQVTKDLQEVSVPFVLRDTCNRPISYGGRINDNMFCAGLRNGGKDACQGDSGGPATTKAAGKTKLAGITSWGEGCGDPHKYGIYTRVPRFVDWVRQQTNGEVSWSAAQAP